MCIYDQARNMVWKLIRKKKDLGLFKKMWKQEMLEMYDYSMTEFTSLNHYIAKQKIKVPNCTI